MKEPQETKFDQQICAQKAEKPYYETSSGIMSQIKSGSRRKGTNPVSFLWKKTINYILERLAYNCPINNWRVRFHRCRGVKIGENSIVGIRSVVTEEVLPNSIYAGIPARLVKNNITWLRERFPRHKIKD